MNLTREPLAADAEIVAELLSEIDRTIAYWVGYADANPITDQHNRHAGYVSGLRLCHDQISGILTRCRGYAEARES
jgi:hypothetical protein